MIPTETEYVIRTLSALIGISGLSGYLSPHPLPWAQKFYLSSALGLQLTLSCGFCWSEPWPLEWIPSLTSELPGHGADHGTVSDPDWWVALLALPHTCLISMNLPDTLHLRLIIPEPAHFTCTAEVLWDMAPAGAFPTLPALFLVKSRFPGKLLPSAVPWHV